MKLAFPIGCLMVLAVTVNAAVGNESHDTRVLYELTVRSARALEDSPFDRSANQKLKALLTHKIDAFSFDTGGNYKGVLLSCEYAARQLVEILNDAILHRRPTPPDQAKLMQERATEWLSEMEGCRRFLKAPANKIDMRAVTRQIVGY